MISGNRKNDVRPQFADHLCKRGGCQRLLEGSASAQDADINREPPDRRVIAVSLSFASSNA